VKPVRLKAETLRAFDAYIREAQDAMQKTLRGASFLWCDADPKRTQKVRKGKIVAEYWGGKGPFKAPDALIHDWVGAAFVPGGTVARTLALIQDYDNHKTIYQPEVIASRLVSRSGEDFKIYLRVLKKKVITVVLDTDHDVHYFSLDPERAGCSSHTTRTAEVDDAGKPTEKVQPPDSGYGFLWRLNTYWRFLARDGGVYLECRAISLTRDIPIAFRLIIDPIVRSLPKEALIQTLKATRDALPAVQTAP
jgi:hypothetical protein